MQVPCNHCGRHLGPFCRWVSLMAWPPAFGGAMEKALATGRNFHSSRVAHPAPALFGEGRSASETTCQPFLFSEETMSLLLCAGDSCLLHVYYSGANTTPAYSLLHTSVLSLFPSGYGNGWRNEGNFACFFDALLSWRHLC